MLAGLLLFLGLVVLVLRVVEHPADRRIGLGRDLHKVEFPILCKFERVRCFQDADLIALIVDQPDLRNPDAVVDPGRVPLRRAPVEPARNRH
jgi:hypothetical protein